MHGWLQLIALFVSCNSNPEVRKLDFWIGDWADSTGTSQVSVSMDRCVFTESWIAGNHQGENVFAYSADSKTWKAFFADNEGRAHVFDRGMVRGDTAEFLAEGNRMLVIRRGPSQVQQIWEKDNQIVFETTYTRRKSAPFR